MDGTRFQVGQYVRHGKEDRGTGKVEVVRVSESIGKDKKIHRATEYVVHWLDLKSTSMAMGASQGVKSVETEDTIQLSARNVPKFSSVEEAEAWIEQQNQPGGWIDKVEDLNATAADVATRVKCACGTIPCECRGCITINEEHIRSDSCYCEDTGCECC